MLRNPFSPGGAINRREYILAWLLCGFTIYFIDAIVQSSIEETGFVMFLIFPVVFILSQGARRCHDMGKSGWWQFVPFYIIWMIFKVGNKDRVLKTTRQQQYTSIPNTAH